MKWEFIAMEVLIRAIQADTDASSNIKDSKLHDRRLTEVEPARPRHMAFTNELFPVPANVMALRECRDVRNLHALRPIHSPGRG